MLDKTKGNTKLEKEYETELQYYFFILSFFFSKCGAQCAMCRAALGGEAIVFKRRQ
jgi:hypothetical protein